MGDLVARTRVVATSVVTWLSVLVTALATVATQLEDIAPDYVRYPVAAAAWLTAVIAVIRDVTPVPPPERGLLPPEAE